MSKPVKNSISYVTYNKDKSKFLAVQRPDDDDDLPGVWGLPAGSVKEGERFEDAVLRSGREKLGVELKIVETIKEGDLEREAYILHMIDYEVAIVSGEPSVPQNVEGVTQYQALKWATADDLKNAAKKGSLCCQLYLKKIRMDW